MYRTKFLQAGLVSQELCQSRRGRDSYEIRSQTTRNWLRKLGFEYKDIRKNVFIDGHERSDVVEDQNKFLTKMEELKPYMVEFKEDGKMKTKNLPIRLRSWGE